MPRAPLLVAMLQEMGHVNPSLRLTRALRERGHDVRYLAVPQLASYLAEQGFDTLPFFPELHEERAARGGLLDKRRLITQHFSQLVDQLAQGDDQLFGERPALAIVDVTQTPVAMWARRHAIPLLLINTSLPQTHDLGVPPLRSGLLYQPSLRGRAQSELAWQRFLLKRRAGARAASLMGMCPPYELARRAAGRFGVARGELDTETMYMPQLKGVPELVLCPPQLDFPRPLSSMRRYAESLDLTHRAQPFEAPALTTQRPTIYCSLGGQLYRARDTPEFLRRVVRVFAARPDWQLVIATGRHLPVAQLGVLPENVLAMERAPQLSVLARADAMITHGGLGSVKECVAYGVPMLVFPLDVDQPGNAARVLYHGMGLRGDVATTHERELTAMVERVLGEASFKRRVADMREKLEALEQQQVGVKTVEALL